MNGKMQNLVQLIQQLPPAQRPDSKKIPLLSISGGQDSMLLMYVFSELHKGGYLPKPHIFHLNHHLRTCADQDLELVSKVSHNLGFTFHSACKPIAAYAKRICIKE